MMSSKERISRLSNLLYWASCALLVILPGVVVVGLAKGWSDPAWLADRFPGLPPGTAITRAKAVGVVLLGALSLPAMLLAFWHMSGLFDLYRSGRILTEACARHILRTGQMLVVLALAGVVIPTLQILALTLDNPPGAKQLSIGVGGDTVGFLLAGGLLVVIGWAMREAARAAEENAGFV